MIIEAQGISTSPEAVHSGELLRITYSGLLANGGADQVYLHAGYGDKWSYVKDYPMQRSANGWQKVLPIEHPEELKFCFKDSASNWDNNAGHNWGIPIQATQFTR